MENTHQPSQRKEATSQLQQFIDEGKRVLMSQTPKESNFRVRKTAGLKNPDKKWVVAINNERYFCKDVVTDIAEVKEYVDSNKDNPSSAFPVFFKANQVVFENKIATIS